MRVMTFHRTHGQSNPSVIVSPFAPKERGSVPAFFFTLSSVIVGLLVWRSVFFRRMFGARRPAEARMIEEYLSADLVVNTGGDLLTEDYGTYSLLVASVHLFVAILAGKRYVLFGESVGPFRSLLRKRLVTFLLYRATLVVVRESVSKEYVESLGIPREQIVCAPDPSFALESSSRERTNVRTGGNRRICVFPNAISWKYTAGARRNPAEARTNYMRLLSDIVRLFVTEGNSEVILIPHVRGEGDFDDALMCREIAQEFRDTGCVLAHDGFGDPVEVRNFLQGVQFVVALRMHAAVAGYATGVPTFCIGYSKKFAGISHDFSSPGWYVNIAGRDLSTSEVESMLTAIRTCWINRELEATRLQSTSLLRAKLERVVSVLQSSIIGCTRPK